MSTVALPIELNWLDVQYSRQTDGVHLWLLYRPSRCLFRLPRTFYVTRCSELTCWKYIALQNDEHGRGPLASYFRGEEMLAGKADTFTANM
jgi:hypothetical protein